MTDQASRFIGTIPQYYDRSLGPRIFNAFARDLAARVARLKPHAVLELAAGTGIVSRELRDQLASCCELLVTDLNAPMLEVAAAKFDAADSVRFETADASKLPFAPASFDAVVCQFGVMFFPEKSASYQQALRVLKPGGHYVFSVWGPWGENPFARIAHDTLAGFFPDDPPGFYRVPFGYCDVDEIHTALAQAGFVGLDAQWLAIDSAIPDPFDFASGLIYGNPVLEEILAREGDPDAICAALAIALERELGSTMPLQALVIQARAP